MSPSFVFIALFCGFASGQSKAVVLVDGNDPGKCEKSNHGQQVLVQDGKNKELLLICIRNGNKYQWNAVGGDNSVGKIFNPGYDCSDVLDKNPEAKDGLYWINFSGIDAKQVWCDMSTDGGGYMLIGRKNSSVTWSVPSKNVPVEPFGDPHWASYLGDAPILDLRIQIATAKDFAETVAHWSFRMQSKRPLKKLMMLNQGGCSISSPGIGNIAYVKDLQTGTIVSTNFRCSVFGGFYAPSTRFGWNMMNSCLNKPCVQGFAFMKYPSAHKFPVQVDHSGSFSYSAMGNSSGFNFDSTAFIGCDRKKCCACHGPLGGTGNYCDTQCRGKNGGTVVKNAYTWFWLRSSIPKRVWNKCMEYKVTNDNGDIVWYRLTDGSNTPQKGRCGKKEALLNNGIIVVPDKKAAKKVPLIPGLLQYRKDNKKLYVRANETWQVVAKEEKVLDKALSFVVPKVKNIERKLEDRTKIIDTINQDLAQLKASIGNINQTVNSIKKSLLDPLFNSIILFGKPDYRRLLSKWTRIQDLKLCWRASYDGWLASTFHSHCDYKKPTVTIVRVNNYIFGGYATSSWEGSGAYKSAPGSFIFSLRNKDNLAPFKSPLKRQSIGKAIRIYPGFGPTFGEGFDLYISNNAALNTFSYSNFGHNYQLPTGYIYGHSDTRSLLAGSYTFTPSEVEVFY